MDPIAHTLVGAALSQSGLGRRSAYAPVALVVGANLPDVDGITMLFGADTALFWRRGVTHGLPALVVLPFVLTALLVFWSCTFGGPRPRVGALLALSSLALATHPALDWLNTYGMRWLMPFDDRWFYGDTLFVVDPWFWLVLGSALFLHHSRKLSSLLAWAGLAGFASFLLFGIVPGLPVAKGLFAAALVTLALLRLRGIGREDRAARQLATTALVLLAVYIGVMHASMRDARRAIAAALTERGVRVERVMVGPRPVTPFLRDVVVDTPEGYLTGEVALLPSFDLRMAAETIPHPDDRGVVGTAIRSPSVHGFLSWARFPFAEIKPTDSGCVVLLRDARYARRGSTGFGTARVEVEGACRQGS